MTGTTHRPRSGHPASPARMQFHQLLQVAAVLAGTVLLAHAGLGPVSRLLFMAAALLVAGAAMARSPWLYLTATLWFWTLTPLVRRLIDQASGFDATNFVLVTPNLMAMLMLRDLLCSPAMLRQRAAAPALLILLPVLYGLAVSFVSGQVVAGMVAAADWLTPTLYFFYVLLHADRIDEAEPHVRTFLDLHLLVVVPYALLQYVEPLSWDVAWAINSGMTTIGTPVSYGLRLFGTLNAPGVLAFWMAVVMLLALGLRSGLLLAMLPFAGAVLLLTLVRAALVIIVIGLLAMLLLGRTTQLRATLGALAPVLLSMTVVGFLLGAVDPETVDHIMERFSTIGSLGEDESALERSAMYAAAPALIDLHPLGLGIGALGRGAVASDSEGFVVVDAGPLAIYLALGWFAGSVYLLGIAALLVQAVRAARAAGSQLALVLAAAALANMSSLVFTNLLGFGASIAWICAGWSIALGLRVQPPQGGSVTSPVPVRLPGLPMEALRPQDLLR